MARVYIAVPNLNYIHRFVVQKLLEIAIKKDREKETHELIFDFHADKPIDSNRNKIISAFLETDYEWFFTMDADNPPKGDPLEHIDKDYDVLAFPTPIWYSEIVARQRGEVPIIWNGFNWEHSSGGYREHLDKRGIQEIDAAGSGAMLIHRRVLEKIRPAFIREYNEFGEVTRGSDLLFCQRAKEAGFKVYMDYNNPCSHYKEIDLSVLYQIIQARDVTNINRTDINTAEHWDERWKEIKDIEILRKNGELYEFISKKVRSVLNGKPEFRVLDFGCGSGVLTEMLSLIDGVKAYGIDVSPVAINRVRNKGLEGEVATEPFGRWDLIIACEVMEHVKDDVGLLQKLFACSDRVIYTVPNNCMPPGAEREHLRCYTEGYVKRITPNLKEIVQFHEFLFVYADQSQIEEKEVDCGSTQ